MGGLRVERWMGRYVMGSACLGSGDRANNRAVVEICIAASWLIP
jgi:hypothetical protein